MALIQDLADPTRVLTVDPTSNAARLIPHDPRGRYCGPKPTYGAATPNAVTVTGGSAHIPFYIRGSATKVVRVHRIMISCPTAAAAEARLNQPWYQGVLGPGASFTATNRTILTNVPFDADDPAGTAEVAYYGSAGGPNFPTSPRFKGASLESRLKILSNTPSATLQNHDHVFEIGISEGYDPIVLRGPNDYLAAWNNSGGGGPYTLAYSAIWTEE